MYSMTIYSKTHRSAFWPRPIHVIFHSHLIRPDQMATLPRHRWAGATILATAILGLVLLATTVQAQANMCYPKSSKRSPMKKGGCFVVSHTLPEFLGRDMVSVYFYF